jgi:hypothetical protein
MLILTPTPSHLPSRQQFLFPTNVQSFHIEDHWWFSMLYLCWFYVILSELMFELTWFWMILNWSWWIWRYFWRVGLILPDFDDLKRFLVFFMILCKYYWFSVGLSHLFHPRQRIFFYLKTVSIAAPTETEHTLNWSHPMRDQLSFRWPDLTRVELNYVMVVATRRQWETARTKIATHLPWHLVFTTGCLSVRYKTFVLPEEFPALQKRNEENISFSLSTLTNIRNK